MKKRFLFLCITALLVIQPALFAQADAIGELKRDIQDVKERVIRLEEGQKNLEKRMNALEARMDKRFDELRGFMLWGFGVLFSGMFILIGFILWDRRTTLAPVVKEIKYNQAEIDEWKKKEKTIIEVLNKYAELDPKLKEILNKAALL